MQLYWIAELLSKSCINSPAVPGSIAGNEIIKSPEANLTGLGKIYVRGIRSVLGISGYEIRVIHEGSLELAL